MTLFQIMMLGASAYFAFKIYEHIQTLEEPERTNTNKNKNKVNYDKYTSKKKKTLETFSPFNADELVEKASNSIAENDFEKALAFLKEADAKDENNADILYQIGYVYQHQNDYDNALSFYKKALDFDKKNEYIHNSIASIYRQNKEFTSAQMHLRSSIDINDKNAVTYYNYGNLLVDIDNKEEAINMYKKAIEIKPDFTEAKEELEKLL